ncbi:MAG: PilT/PilU family type 4a pilus ATPase [Patescibacteria group bacterium]|nr:PilT/PilU family type 4a pilus ATPase [Patescibacteria group bacterium]
MAINIEEIFKEAAAMNASDVHLVVGHCPIFRIDGNLNSIKKWPMLTQEDMQEVVESLTTPEQRKRLLENKETDLSFNLGKLIRARISVFWERGNLSLSARIILPHIPTMEEITMPPIAYRLARESGGLIIVTGPAGCGKSTSLAAMIELINQERVCRIITLEDPIEFIFNSKKSIIVQRELDTDMNSFQRALKYIVRQDPNVIMVGEMRDLETMSSTITLAETGHLVLTTLHTFDAVQAVNRIIDVFPPQQQVQIRIQLSLSLKGIIAQKLIPKVNGGRIAAREVLINTPAVANLIRENKIAQIKSVIQTGAEEGMFTFDQNLKKLYEDGLITRETALAHMSRPQDLAE